MMLKGGKNMNWTKLIVTLAATAVAAIAKEMSEEND